MNKKHAFFLRSRMFVALNAALSGIVAAIPAHAVELESGNPDLQVSWANTLKYSAAWRLRDPDARLTSAAANSNNANLNDGDLNFNKGQISNRLDLLSEFDLSYQNVGLRVSGAGWYDTAYKGRNDHPNDGTANQFSTSYKHFTDATRTLHGRHAEVLDAFVFGKFNLGNTRAAVRLGKHAMVWGETLFFGSNGIAGGMMPVDVIKLLSVPSTQFKEAIRPVPMISGQLQLTPAVTVGAYYQFRWEPNRLPAVGSYFSQADTNPAGAEQLLLTGGTSPFLKNAPRLHDQSAKDSGQGGVQLRFSANETDYGLYLTRYHSKGFQQVSNLGFAPTVIPVAACGFAHGVPIGGTCNLVAPVSYRLAYHEGITAFGASFSHTFGDVNVAGEASYRRNQDLASPNSADASALGAAATDNRSNPAYAVGNTAHVNLSALWTLPPTALFREASFVGEIAWNRLLHVSKHASALDPNATRDATALRFVLEPTYRQVVPGLDIGVPIGLGYGLGGSRSAALGPGVLPPAGGGDMSIGINGAYLDVWRFSMAYTHFFGDKQSFLVPTSATSNSFSYKQSLADRDFIALSVRRTF